MQLSQRRSPRFDEPLSRVVIPLALGITRRAMLSAGVQCEARSVAGISLNYYTVPTRGGDPTLPVILLHGIADSALTWAFTLRGMAAIGPVYAVDLPGFGASGSPRGRRFATIAEHVAVITTFIREIVGRPALVVGNSMGGWIAARLAELAPELLRGMVLCDPGGAMLEGRSSWEPFMQKVAVRDLRAVRTIYREMFGRVNPALYLGQLGFQDLFLRDAVRDFVATTTEEEFFTPADLRAIKVPTALVWGQRDAFLPAGSFEFFRANLPDARVLELPGCGHLPQRERPRRLVRFVRDFAQALPELQGVTR